MASALGYIIHIGNHKQLETKEKIVTYRGIKVNKEKIKDEYEIGKNIHLLGFTSTSLIRDRALKFAIQNKQTG